MFKKYYCIKQQDITDCGAACLATISKQYGLKISITHLREVCGTDKQGTNLYGLIKAANELGFTVKAVKGDKESFFSEFPLPCIAHVIIDGMLLHYVVIHKRSKNKPLTEESKAYNRNLSRQRIVIENINRRVKRFDIFSDTYRNKRKRYGLRMTLICAIHNMDMLDS